MITNEKLLELLNKGEIDKAKDALKENIREEVEKGKGTKKSDLTIIKGLLKESEKRFGKYNKHSLKYCNTFLLNGNSYFGFSDGYRVFANTDTDYGYEMATESLDFTKLFPTEYKHEYEVDMNDLKVFAKTEKEKSYIFEVNGIRVGVNPKYLLDALNYCGNNKIYLNNAKSPIFCSTENKDKICLVLTVYIR